jgi:recombination protein RecA
MMAKKKTVDNNLDKLKKELGDIFTTGEELFKEEESKKLLSISPAFDVGLNGGLMEGTWTNIAGDSNVGKTTLSTQILANAQIEGRETVFIDAENKLHNYIMKGISGFDPEKMTKISVKPGGKALAAEDYMNVMFELAKDPKYFGSVWLVDSWSAMQPRAELDGEISGQVRNQMPKLLGNFIRKMHNVVKSQNIIMISILHQITNTSGYGKLKNADCGVYIQYTASTKIQIKRAPPWEENGEQVGIIPECHVERSAAGATGSIINSYIRFGIGIDKIKEIIEMGECFGLIDKTGAWFRLEFLDKYPEHKEIAEQKIQGIANVQEFLQGRDDLVEILQKELKEIL